MSGNNKKGLALKRTRMAVGLALLLAAQGVQAQSAPPRDQAARELDRIQQEQQQRLDRERAERLSRQPRTTIEVPLDTPAAGGTSTVCRDIAEVRLFGADAIEAKEQAELTAPFVGQCLAVTDIERLLGAVVNRYVQRGNIAARAYIQTQNLAEGVLNILVLEGKVEALRLEDGGRDSLSLATAFPGVIGQVLNIRDLEQGLDRVNRLGSNSATLELQPGTEPGFSTVVIRNEPRRRLRASLTADNSGSESTGEDQSSLTLQYDNPVGINDGVVLSYRSTVGGDFGLQHSRSSSVIYSLPYGRWLLTATQLFSDYATPVELESATAVAEGDTTSTSLRADYALYRDQINMVSVATTVAVKDTESLFQGERLDVSSQTLSSAQLELSWSTALWKGGLYSRIGLSQGLDILGADEDPSGLPATAPHAQYQKWTAGINWRRPFAVGTRALDFSTALSVQWSDDTLYGSEKLLVGSLFSVRGFRNNSASGERGYTLRNDVGLPFRVGTRRSFLVRPYLGLDAGRVEKFRDQAASNLGGGALGVSISGAGLNLEIQAQWALHEPSNFSDEGTLFYANLGYSL